MAIEQNKNYTLKGSQIEDLAGRVNDAQENASNALEGLSNKVDKEAGKGLSTNDFTNSDKTKLDSIESNAQENTIESVSVNGTEVAPDANKNVDINVPAVENSLTSESTVDALSAAQGKALKELIDNAGGIKTLTTADYNYPATGTKTAFDASLADVGIYKTAQGNFSLKVGGTFYGLVSGVLFLIFKIGATTSVLIQNDEYGRLRILRTGMPETTPSGIILTSDTVNNLTNTSTVRPLSAAQGKVLKDLIDSIAIRGAGAPTTSTVGTAGQLYEDGTNGALYQLKSIDITVTPNTYNWEQVGGGSGGDNVFVAHIQYDSTGGSIQPVKESVTDLEAAFNAGKVIVFAPDPDSLSPVASSARITALAVTSIFEPGNSASILAIGGMRPYTTPTSPNVAIYRFNLNRTNNKITLDTSATYYPVPTVVQTTGTSTTDVMSQNAVTGMVFPRGVGNGLTINGTVNTAQPNSTDTIIGQDAYVSGTSGAGNTLVGYNVGKRGGTGNTLVGSASSVDLNNLTTNYNTAVGYSAKTVTTGAGRVGAIAIGAYSQCSADGEMNIGSTDASYGYNSSNYRLLTGLYDPQSDHDAATKGYVDTNIPDAPDSADFNALFD